MRDYLIKLENIGLRRDSRWLVRSIDLTVKAGEILTLIGPNGSGKSTTAKIALGVLRPDEGKVIQRPSLKIGYVPQKLNISRALPLTVKRLMNLTSRISERHIIQALEKTDVAHLLNAHAQNLSGGEFQRILLARAIARQPDFLVLDEPVQNVDLKSEIAIYNLISEIRDKSGCGILLISHNLHVVMAATDRIICLNGHICCSGTPKSVKRNPAYQKLFGKTAASALAVYEHEKSHDHSHGEYLYKGK